jgi:hypothetical protein
MTKRVAWFTGEPSVKACFTPYKVYEVVREENTNFSVINDKGIQNFCLKKGCAHICHKDWVLADVVEEEKKVDTAKAEEVKRKGAVTLLPEDSKFEIGQRVQVDRSGYIGYTTIVGYNYDYDEYATECDKDNDCSHDCRGLAKEKGKGLWITESDIVESVEAKQHKWSEWIENTTGKCPEGLKRKQKIKLKWSDGDEFNISKPHDAAWYIDKGGVNITHYKVKLKDLEKSKTKWTKNKGVCPVDSDVKVEIKMKNGDKECALAKHFSWGFDDQEWDIVKWRLAD